MQNETSIELLQLIEEFLTTRSHRRRQIQDENEIRNYLDFIMQAIADHLQITTAEVAGKLIEGFEQVFQNKVQQQSLRSALRNPDGAHTPEMLLALRMVCKIGRWLSSPGGRNCTLEQAMLAIWRATVIEKKVDLQMVSDDNHQGCAICLGPVELGEEVSVLYCSHWFHSNCFAGWTAQSVRCPLCRMQF